MTDPLVPPSDSDAFLNARVGPLARKIQLLLVRSALRPEGLTIQEWRAMLALARLGPSNVAQVVEDSVLDPAHASRTVTGLVKKRFIARKRDPDDRRRQILTLTREGEAAFRRIWPVALQINAEVVASFKPEDVALLRQMLDRAISAANAMLARDALQDNKTQETDDDA